MFSISLLFKNLRYLGRFNIKTLNNDFDKAIYESRIYLSNIPYEVVSILNESNFFLPTVMSIDDTIDAIISKNLSVSRFGDGEFRYLIGEKNIRNVYFNTEFCESLQQRLLDVINSKSKNHLICLWDFFGSLEAFDESAKGTARYYMPILRDKLKVYLRRDYTYGNAFISRPYISYKDREKSRKIFDKLKKIWENRNVVIIEGEFSRLGVGNDLFDNAKSIKRLLCPSENAFKKYDEILQSIKEFEKNNLILIALGMTATILAYDLANLGYQAIDIGHIDIEYECFCKNTKNYKCVKNKYINDAGIRKVKPCKSQDYLKQIIKVIK